MKELRLWRSSENTACTLSIAMMDEEGAQLLRHPAVDGLHLIEGEEVKSS
jgi:hypothetical protein